MWMQVLKIFQEWLGEKTTL